MYRKFVKISLAIVYLVIVAGAIVRMTGSGMGCPDWPKCFGYYIPPTTEEEITWKPNEEYFKGQIIIYNEALKVAQSNFTSGQDFDASNWKVYEKHSYNTFNATHTWIEYINRLLGALSGVAVLLMTIFSFKYWKKQKRITLVSVFTLLLLLIQAWLGATVVYSELLPVRITIHMLVALVITALLIYLLSISRERNYSMFTYSKQLEYLLGIGIFLSLVQIAMGTQVRQAVDDSVRMLGYEGKSEWIDNPGLMFYIHRSFSILVVAVNLGIWWLNKNKQLHFPWTPLLLIVLGIEVLSGIAMFYLDFPFGTQAMHLVFASLLFGVQFYIYRLVKQTRKFTHDL
jgi:cytochrome c oxidase assembly protein subunit 15